MSTFDPAALTQKDGEFYEELARSLESLISSEPDQIAQLANASALIFHHVKDLNWAGFYLSKGGGLVVGPFQGKPACTRIAFGRGVCGKVAETKTTLVVPDVHEFPGHIACDAESRSELVLPLLNSAGNLWGLLDLDSPKLARFSQADEAGFEKIRKVIEQRVKL